MSADLSIVDLDVPFCLTFATGSSMNAYSNIGVLIVFSWQVLFVCVPVMYAAVLLQVMCSPGWTVEYFIFFTYVITCIEPSTMQKYYFASAKELMRLNGVTKSLVANHLTESVAGAMTIRAFAEEDRFFAKNLDLIDTNASPFFYNFTANEWLIQRLEMLCATVLATVSLCVVLLPPGTFSPG